jgi:two-component system response regulator (stage 0 sporulation protein A)
MNIEEKLNAIIEYILAETEQEKATAVATLRNADTTKRNVNNAEEEIANILVEIGVPEHIKGHRYAVYAIQLVVDNPDIIDSITGELYPAVAERFNTTNSRVERAIRHGIECAWDRSNLDVIKKRFGNTISCTKGKPTNSEFVARIANIVRRRVGSA